MRHVGFAPTMYYILLVIMYVHNGSWLSLLALLCEDQHRVLAIVNSLLDTLDATTISNSSHGTSPSLDHTHPLPPPPIADGGAVLVPLGVTRLQSQVADLQYENTRLRVELANKWECMALACNMW